MVQNETKQGCRRKECGSLYGLPNGYARNLQLTIENRFDIRLGQEVIRQREMEKRRQAINKFGGSSGIDVSVIYLSEFKILYKREDFRCRELVFQGFELKNTL